MPDEAGGNGWKTVRAVSGSLSSHPLALALVLINVAFLAAGTWGLRHISAAGERRDAMLAQLLKDCGAK